jgi:ATP-dependent Lon protease
MNTKRRRKGALGSYAEADLIMTSDVATDASLAVAPCGAIPVEGGHAIEATNTTTPVFDVGTAGQQIEQLIGRPYHGHLEEYLGSPFPQLSEADQSRLDRLMALYDDPKRGHRNLLFGSEALVEALAAERSRCPGFETIIDLVSRSAMLSRRTGSPMFVPPLLLAGPPGVGKTHASGRIARALATDVHIINCATNSDFQALTVGHPTSWKAAAMGRLTEAMTSGASAQPVIVLDEIDKLVTHASEQPYHSLLAVLEAENSRALLDEFLRVHFDLSRAIIVATANDVGLLPDYIRDRLTTFAIAPPRDEALLAVAGLIASDIVAELRGGVDVPGEDVLRRAARHNPRRIGKLLRLAFGFAAAEDRSALTLYDIVAAEGLAVGSERPRRIGFVTPPSGTDGSSIEVSRVDRDTGPSRN